MNLAQKLHDITKQTKAKIEVENRENIDKAVKHFTEGLEVYAKMGRNERRTTYLVHQSGERYHCQTENDGDGFNIDNMSHVIKGIEALGFEVDLKKKKGYCPLTIKW